MKGTPFEKVLLQFSNGPRKKYKGIWKYQSEEDISDKDLAKVIQKAKINEVSRPIATSYGFVIFRVLERRAFALKDFYAIQDQINRILRERRYQKILNSLKRKFKKKLFIQRFQPG